MKLNCSYLTMAAILGMFPVANAQAENSANAVLSGFGYTLVDLLPNDGILPYINFEPLPDRTNFGNVLIETESYYGNKVLSSESENLALGSPAGSGSSSKAVDSGVFSLGTETIQTSASAPDMANSFAYISKFYAFNLSPGTRVIFSGMAEAGVSNTSIRTPTSESVLALVALTGHLTTSQASFELTRTLWLANSYDQLVDIHNQTFMQLSFDNATSQWATGDFNTGLHAYTLSGVTGVPEPSTLMLTLAGMTALGLRTLGASRRRKYAGTAVAQR